MAYENIKDILAVGFNPENTFVFVNSEYMQHLYPAVARFQKYVTYN
jgi:tryptophanyl-tRNA synthetase